MNDDTLVHCCLVTWFSTQFFKDDEFHDSQIDITEEGTAQDMVQLRLGRHSGRAANVIAYPSSRFTFRLLYLSRLWNK